MNWSEPAECALCGEQGRGIEYQLVEWLDPLPGMRWAHVPRCDDRSACRARVEATTTPDGKPAKWPIVDSSRDAA